MIKIAGYPNPVSIVLSGLFCLLSSGSAIALNQPVPSVLSQAETPTNDLIADAQLLKHRTGQFNVFYKPSPNQSHQILQEGLRKSGLFESLVANLNRSGLVMRYDIPVIFADCGQANAFYNSKDKSITMCNELIFTIRRDFVEKVKVPEKEALEDAIFTSVFVFTHELGHALIDVLSLPAVGNEEDAADQFSALYFINTENTELINDTVLNAAIWQSTQPEIPAWAEHSPNQVRFYSLICLIYGSNPTKYSRLISPKILPEQRARRCPKEYVKVSSSWAKLLVPHFVETSRPWGSTSGPPGPPAKTVPAPQRDRRIW